MRKALPQDAIGVGLGMDWRTVFWAFCYTLFGHRKLASERCFSAILALRLAYISIRQVRRIGEKAWAYWYAASKEDRAKALTICLLDQARYLVYAITRLVCWNEVRNIAKTYSGFLTEQLCLSKEKFTDSPFKNRTHLPLVLAEVEQRVTCLIR